MKVPSETRSSGPGRVIPKTIQLVFTSSLLSKQHNGARTKTGWPGVRMMCTSGATCICTRGLLFQKGSNITFQLSMSSSKK
jgi:hypothetical protein